MSDGMTHGDQLGGTAVTSGHHRPPQEAREGQAGTSPSCSQGKPRGQTPRATSQTTAPGMKTVGAGLGLIRGSSKSGGRAHGPLNQVRTSVPGAAGPRRPVEAEVGGAEQR